MKRLALFIFALSFAAPAAAQTINENRVGFSSPGASQIGYLVADVQSGDSQRVRQAMNQLRGLADSDAAQLIQAALTTSSVPGSERRKALEDAARRGKKVGQDMMILALQRGDDSLKNDVLRLVRGKDRDFAVPVLQAALSDAKPRIRVAAVQAAAGMDGDTARRILKAAAADSDVTVKMQVVTSTAGMPQADAWDVLKPLCRDSNKTVSARARSAAKAKGVDLKANGVAE